MRRHYAGWGCWCPRNEQKSKKGAGFAVGRILGISLISLAGLSSPPPGGAAQERCCFASAAAAGIAGTSRTRFGCRRIDGLGRGGVSTTAREAARRRVHLRPRGTHHLL